MPFVLPRRERTRSNAVPSRAGSNCGVFSATVPLVGCPAHAPVELRTGDERRNVHFIVDGDKAMVRGDDEGRVRAETGVLDRATQHTNTVISRGQRCVREVVRRSKLVLCIVGHEQVNGRERWLLTTEHVGGGLCQREIAGPLSERVTVKSVVAIDRHARRPQFLQQAGRHRRGICSPTRREHLGDVEVDGWIVLRLWPEERRRAEAGFLDRIEECRHTYRIAPRDVRDVKALPCPPLDDGVVDDAVLARCDAGHECRVRRMRDAWKHCLAAVGRRSRRGQLPNVRQVDRRVCQVKRGKAVDGDEDHVPAGRCLRQH